MIPYLPERLRIARTQAGLSQGQIADACGVSQPAVSKWETGISNALGCNEPDLASLVTIARRTGQPVSWFLGENESTEPLRITATEVEAETHHGEQLAILLAGPDHDLYEKITVNSFRLHLALGITTPYPNWLEQQLDARPFVADQDYFVVLSPHRPRHYWSFDVAKGLALLEGSARGFAVWRTLIKLEKTYQTKPKMPSTSIVEGPATAPTLEPSELKVSPGEFVEITACCLKIAHQMGLNGEDAMRGADQATLQLTGWSPRQVLGLAT